MVPEHCYVSWVWRRTLKFGWGAGGIEVDCIVHRSASEGCLVTCGSSVKAIFQVVHSRCRLLGVAGVGANIT